MLLLKNATVVHFEPPSVEKKTDVLIDGNEIIETGRDIAPRGNDVKVIDLDGDLLSPGIVCSHNHFYSALARGITAEIEPSCDFVSILQNLWWRLDRAIDEEILYYSGLIGALEAIKSGTTSVIDHHASPSFIKGSLEVLKETFEIAGLRGILCYEVTDRNGVKGMQEGIEENVAFAEMVDKETQSGGVELIEAAIGAHAPFTLSNDALKGLSEACRSTRRGIHIHIAEDRYDPSYSHHIYEKDITQRLEEADLLDDKSICVHGVHLTDADIERLNTHDSLLVHNARSNMNNSIGYAEKLARVRRVALGTDGIGSDMFEEMKFAFFKHRDAGGSYWPQDFAGFLHNGNSLLENYFNARFGKVGKGYKADLVIYDYKAPTPLVSENVAGHIAFGLCSRDVKTVIVNGSVCYEDRRFPIDIGPIYEKAQKAADRLWKRMEKIQ
ncbi:MAG: putative aminohydrolase SsnA [Spirochaetota bacterium]|nr:MAG: putative aminohydrolase SsnA [Spirochaetota bacterium]